MPLYEYKCDACEHEFVEYQKMSQVLVPCENPCPKCSEEKVRRQITGIGGFQADVPPKLNSDFKETMRGIKKASGRGCTIPDY